MSTPYHDTMSNVLILPVHPPKTLDLIRFLYSCNLEHCHTPILLVCTTTSEAHEISQRIHSSACATHLKIHMFVVDTWAAQVLGTPAQDYLLHNQNNCVVNFKKFAALHHAHVQGYQFAVMIDVDTLCMGSMDAFMQTARMNYAKAEWWGCAVDDQSIGIGPCTISTGVLGTHVQDWCKQNNTFRVYDWFLDPPSYQMPHVKLMFDHVSQVHGSLSNFFMQTSWFTFDFLVYSQFCASQGMCKIKDYSDLMGVNTVPEILTVDQLLQLKYAVGVEPSWISTAAWLKNPSLVKMLLPKCHMMYHVDRPWV